MINETEYSVINADCAAFLKELPDDSFDSLVTDPPAGIGFMGKSWDSDKGGRDEWIAWLGSVMKEALRVMKPGAHGLVWALPRTSHWTATALEDAGFEIRDVITHHFGTGFPKSLNVSIAIDKAAGAMVARGAAFRTAGAGDRLDIQDKNGQYDIERHEGITPAAKQWSGWGTALKPASEHWILIRKPLDGTVAANVQKHGTGALNIDASRIAADLVRPKDSTRKPHDEFGTFKELGGSGRTTGSGATDPAGRWPANLILSHSTDCAEACAPGCPVAELDEQSGERKSGGGNKNTGNRDKQNAFGSGLGKGNGDGIGGDSGGASRFFKAFYCAKPSKKERGADNNHPTVKSKALMTYLIRLITPPGGLVLDPFCGSGSTGVAAVAGGWSFLGIEQDAGFAKIAEGRIAGACPSARKAA